MLPIRFRTTPNKCAVIEVEEPYSLFAGFLNGEGKPGRADRLLELIDDSLSNTKATTQVNQDYAVLTLNGNRQAAQLKAENLPEETIEECEMPLELLRQITSEWLNYLKAVEEEAQ